MEALFIVSSIAVFMTLMVVILLFCNLSLQDKNDRLFTDNEKLKNQLDDLKSKDIQVVDHKIL